MSHRGYGVIYSSDTAEILAAPTIYTMTGTLVLLRHGQSTWNELNLFTGWHDVELTEQGVREAAAAGATMKEAGLVFDIAHTSLLRRAIETNHLALSAMGLNIPIERTWRLNERHYGALQGLDKKETTLRHGAEQTMIWRRSFDVPPPPVDATSPEHPANDPRYQQLVAEGLDASLLPATECLADVLVRVLPYWNDVISPQLREGKNVLITAHGNSLRALVMHLEDISRNDIVEFNIPTGVPRLYELSNDLVVKSVAYMGDQDAIAAATEAVAKQASGNH
ncbi:2,3-bisphosphoglycerate-dependent phosphoglycerate mutase [Actinomycetes bacterium]|nr:2,3-bisphosphoglycerate-dependent phosphoglycerate mutase [Actinomycetes bacterium]